MNFLLKFLLKRHIQKLDQFELYQVKTKYGIVFISIDRAAVGSVDMYIKI